MRRSTTPQMQTFLMKRSLVLLFASLACQGLAVPSYDPFADATGSGGTSYAVGSNLVGQYNRTLFGPWFLRGSTFPGAQPTIAAGSLSYPQFAPSSGNSVSIVPANSMSACIDMNVAIGHTDTAYYSFLLQITDLSAVPNYATNNPIAAFLDDPSLGNTTAQIGRLGSRLLTKKVGAGYVLGIGRSASIASFVYEPDAAAHNVGDVLFVVACYQRVAGVQTNVDLWVNPPASSFGLAQPPAPTLVAPYPSSTAGGINNNSARAFGILCQFPSAPSGIIDEVRVATNDWAYVTGRYLNILQDPVSQALPPGHDVSFSVGAQGTAPLTYQWIKDGSTVLADVGRISGAQTATLTISNITSADAGSYAAYVTNVFGDVLLSGSATLTVSDPGIISQPQSRTNDFATTATFTVGAAGTEPFTYQWHKVGVGDLTDGGNISGSQSNVLAVSSVAYPDGGSYWVTVSNALGAAADSATAELTVNDPIITSQPVSVSAIAGSNVTFQVVAAGSGPLTYTWMKNGALIFDGGNVWGTSSDTLQITNVALVNQGNYSVQIIGAYNTTVTSSNATLTVTAPIPPGTTVWTGGGGANQNWSTPANWSGGAVPTGTNDVVFNDTAATASPGATNPPNNIVDVSATISSLSYVSTNGSHNTQIPTGSTLMVTNGFLMLGTPLTGDAITALFVGTGSDNGAISHYQTIQGQGTLVVSNPVATINVRQGSLSDSTGTHLATLDLAGLNTLRADVSYIIVAGDGASSSTPALVSPQGQLILAKTNVLVLHNYPGILLGEVYGAAGAGTLLLGQTSAILNDSDVIVGGAKCTGRLQFNAGLTNPYALFRNTTNGPQASWFIADNANVSGQGAAAQSVCDFSGGYVDALVDTICVARGENGNGSGISRGALTFDQGIINVNTLQVGYQYKLGTSGALGIVNVNGTANLVVNTNLLLGNYFGGSSTISSGTLNINGGTVTVSGNLQDGSGLGASVISMNGGSLSVAGILGTNGSPMGTLALTNGALTLTVPATPYPTDGLAIVSNLVSASSAVRLNLSGATLAFGQYPVIKYGTFSGIVPTLGTLPAGISGFLSNNIANSSIDLVVGTATPPQFSSIILVGSNVVLSLTGGAPGGMFRILSSTNVAPGSIWTPIATNFFDASGSFTFTTAIVPGYSQQFYRAEQ